ncbi:isocitrate/isopropylmalate dehydrogenase family protein [Labilibacter marinus]|uniref:isocitrate/isopropylmalate dehydrogenase family protein n=1 Tax=Labilibacter marinus TaxID=1477105 RepID=UPI00082C8831|nr:isocitrate/isopropylmalate family dehydrogenase [Labilibacter marinus]
MKNYKIAVIPGDGIGHEIVPAAVKILDAVASKNDFELTKEDFTFGAGHYLKNGEFMPENGLEILKGFDAIFFGAVGLPAVDDSLPAKDYTFKVRSAFRQYANYRPVRTYAGIDGPLKSDKEIDMVVVRENTEGEFVQIGGQFFPDFENGFGVDTSVFTRKGTERIAHYAFKLARTRRNKVTFITKSNTLINSLTYWDRVINEVAVNYPDVKCERMYIDAAAANFVLKPETFDVVLTTNSYGDILSDLGGAIMGSLGLGGSGNVNPEKDYPSMFEPIHGSAPDIAGENKANPYGQIWSAAIMLEHLGESEAAQQIMVAMDKATADGILSVDLGGKYATDKIADEVIKRL